MNAECDTILRIPHNACEGNVWPTLSVSKTQPERAILYQIEQNKWRKPEVIHHQFSQLKPLVAQAFEMTPFHRNRRDATGLAPNFDYQRDVWESLSPLTRGKLQGAEHTIHLVFAPADHSSIFGIDTSGYAGEARNEAFR